ncbi:hypothetical protein LTR36_005040 [Oleoguttula mirabilis]|uniref:Tail assembly chaperone n=1 Tax=Oleoguttula mirabilis TaxID=1507867 RepID=A0AAV9JW22_9PEZI|nr:hypothetical protein LTR36_005040 [Oleoguttula mirabilis]
MADYADGLFAIEVDADDYAETAAGDVPVVPRTFQSEAAFRAQKAAYIAKGVDGNNYEQLLNAVPLLRPKTGPDGDTAQAANGGLAAKLSKKDLQLLGYTVGELYHDHEYAKVIELCVRVKNVCQLDERTMASLQKWIARCWERLQTAG